MDVEPQEEASSIGRLVAELDRLAREAGTGGGRGPVPPGAAGADANVSAIAAQLRLAQTWVEPPAGLRACVLCRALRGESEDPGPARAQRPGEEAPSAPGGPVG